MEHCDPLTGLPTMPTLETALGVSIEQGAEIALALLDIDYFMEINTRFGHPVGDRLLRTLASLLAENARGQVFRISGDEFAVLLPGRSLEQAFLEMESLRSWVEKSAAEFSLPDGRSVHVTIGVAQFPRDGRDAQELFKAADAALMTAKENDRNQVALPPNEEMVLKSCHYPVAGLRKLKSLAERVGRKESHLLREALSDLIRKYDTARPA